MLNGPPRSIANHCGSLNALDQRVPRFPSTARSGVKPLSKDDEADVTALSARLAGGGGVPFDTFSVMDEDRVLPAASDALAFSVWEPFETVQLSQATSYGALESRPICASSTKKVTPTTPTLSEAAAVTLMDPEIVAPDAGAVSETVGEMESESRGGGGVLGSNLM